MSKKKNKIYVVWDGREPGIYKTWDECKKQIHQYENAIYKSFDNEAAAKEAFLSPYWKYVGKNIEKVKPNVNNLPENKRPILESMAVDAACSGNPGKMEYRGVYTKDSSEVFHQGPFEDGTNNIGEFLALVHGLALLKQKNSNLPVYSDSKTAIKWVQDKKCKTKHELSELNKPLFELITRAEGWLAVNSFTTKILKWDTDNWGEIPADFGRK